MERELDKTSITRSYRLGPARTTRLASVKPNANFSQHKFIHSASELKTIDYSERPLYRWKTRALSQLIGDCVQMILDIIARNNTVAQTVKTQQLWFIIVVAGFKMLYFLILAYCFHIIQVYILVRLRNANLVLQNNLIIFLKLFSWFWKTTFLQHSDIRYIIQLVLT